MTGSVFISVIVFAALVLVLSLQGLAASGHFPRAPEKMAAPGPFVLYGSIAVALVCLVAGVAAAAQLMPWHTAVIGGGLALLAAPLVLQQFSDSFVNGSGAIIGFAAAAIATALMLLALSERLIAL